LARDVLQVAEPVLRLSPCLTADDLLAIIKDFGPRYAAAIAARNTDAPEADAPAPRAAAIRRTAPADAATAAKAAAASEPTASTVAGCRRGCDGAARPRPGGARVRVGARGPTARRGMGDPARTGLPP